MNYGREGITARKRLSSLQLRILLAETVIYFLKTKKNSRWNQSLLFLNHTQNGLTFAQTKDIMEETGICIVQIAQIILIYI